MHLNSEPLVGDLRSGSLVPTLAVWRDQTMWGIKVRPHVTFHNGDPFHAVPRVGDRVPARTIGLAELARPLKKRRGSASPRARTW